MNAQAARAELRRRVPPAVNEIAFGRGSHGNYHSANIEYRARVAASRGLYQRTPRTQKNLVAQGIVDRLYQDGYKFVKFDPDMNEWVAVPIQAAYDKAQQALREKPKENEVVEIMANPFDDEFDFDPHEDLGHLLELLD